MSYKQITWKRVQMKRDAWERKYAYLFKVTLNKQFKELAGKIDTTNIGSNSVLSFIDKGPIEKMFIDLYSNVGAAFAKDSFTQLKSEHGMLVKAEEEYESQWRQYMASYVRTRAGNKITSITEESRKQALKIIRQVLDSSTEEGWGADETARQVRKALLNDGTVLNQWRALRIARTEIVSASNAGAMKGAEDTGMPMQKYWIATYDARTRDTHLVVEQQNPLDMDGLFNVGGYQMGFPGSDEGGPEETVNCRCSVAFEVKRV